MNAVGLKNKIKQNLNISMLHKIDFKQDKRNNNESG